MGTSSMLRGLMSGHVTPCGMRSKFERSFSVSRARLASGSEPTLKRAMTSDSPGREVE